MKNKQRKEKKLLEVRAELVLAALNNGKMSRREICQATGLQRHDLQNLFSERRDVYAEYVVRRRTVAEAAADNIQEIVNDKNHPQNFQASKFVLQNYKSDFEETLDPIDSELNIELPDSEEGESMRPIVIRFGKGKKKEEEEDE